jgi:uncharacterized membrane protein SpoIIM required for sporulation
MTPVALRRWLESRRGDWSRIESLLADAHPQVAGETATARMIEDYRALAHDLAVVRRELPGTDLVRRLEAWLRQLHLLLNRDYEPARERLLRLYRDEIPELFHRLRPTLSVVVLIFIGSAIAAWLLVYNFPELSALFASEGMIDNVERGQLWTDGIFNIVPSSVMSTGIIANNVTVALMSFLIGSLYGIGTLYMVILNGAMLGGVFALTARHGLAGALFRFIVAHGVVELSVIMLAATAGVRLGEALVRPGQRTRTEAFRAAVGDAGRLLAVVVPFLFLAGMIEGFVSPADIYGIPERMLVGALSGVLLWAVLSGKAWRRTEDPHERDRRAQFIDSTQRPTAT